MNLDDLFWAGLWSAVIVYLFRRYQAIHRIAVANMQQQKNAAPTPAAAPPMRLHLLSMTHSKHTMSFTHGNFRPFLINFPVEKAATLYLLCYETGVTPIAVKEDAFAKLSPEVFSIVEVTITAGPDYNVQFRQVTETSRGIRTEFGWTIEPA